MKLFGRGGGGGEWSGGGGGRAGPGGRRIGWSAGAGGEREGEGDRSVHAPVVWHTGGQRLPWRACYAKRGRPPVPPTPRETASPDRCSGAGRTRPAARRGSG